jgi:hypothetical protein
MERGKPLRRLSKGQGSKQRGRVPQSKAAGGSGGLKLAKLANNTGDNAQNLQLFMA